MKVDLNYNDVWSAMNALEELSSKLISARAVIDSASEYASKDDCDQAEKLSQAALDLINWYIDAWDEKFQTAWNVTVSAIKHAEFDEAKKNNPNFFGSQYTDDEINSMCDKAYEDQITFNYLNK
jgi:hypothetical protein